MKYVLWPLLCLALSMNAQEQDITGVWRVIASSWNLDTKQYADCEMIKFITNTRWASLFYWKESGEFAGAGGGTYQWVDEKYVEYAEYYSWDRSAVGAAGQPFKMTIQGGRLVQEGNLDTDKYKYPLHIVFEKMDNLSSAYSATESPQGVWHLVQATYGENSLVDKQAVVEKYGSVIKIITPKYFISAFYNKTDKTFDGASFGTYKVRDGKYTETIKHWSWDDKSMIGEQPSFDWEVNASDEYVQKGVLNSDQYDNYVIDEKFERIEPLVPAKKYWTEADRKTLLDNLVRSRKEMESLTKNLSDQQWHYKPSPDSWNIAQVVEHISLYDRFVIQEARVSFNLPPRRELAETTFEDNTYLDWMAETNPHVSPKNGVPHGLMKGADNLIFFGYGRDLLEEQVSNTNRDLRAHFTPRSSEASKHRSIHGLFTVHFGHTDRHIRQVKRILADKGFPADKS